MAMALHSFPCIMTMKSPCLTPEDSANMHEHPSQDSGPLVHLAECDLIDESTHLEQPEEHDAWGVLESGNANNLTTPLLQSDVQAVPLSTGGDYSCETEQIAYTRSEYLYARAFKHSPDCPIGVFLVNRQDAVYISRIAPDGLFSKSNLRAGDRLMSVNGVSCLHAPAKRVAKLIRAAEGSISLTVRNKGGNPNWVSSSVQKPAPHRMAGIGFKNRRGALYLTRVDSTGLFGDSLIMPGHRCLIINGYLSPNTPSREAARIIAEAQDFVTIISRPDASSAMVLAWETEKVWYSRAALVFGVAAGVLGAAGSLTN